MDVVAMRGRCPGAGMMGVERLAGYRFVIGPQGFAGLVPDPAADVWGVLWSVTPADVAALDEYEGLSEGLYRRATFSVAGGPALIYVPAELTPGRPQPGYLEAVIAAARHRGLPDEYVEELETWLERPRDVSTGAAPGES
jgi:gamma-glutamylcyclotransferase (GGCT)/AIG2-like uncharacterized protein YtfP